MKLTRDGAADVHIRRKRGRPFAAWLIALAAFPPATWTKVQSYRTQKSAEVRACQLRRRVPHVRFKAVGLEVFAIARKGAS